MKPFVELSEIRYYCKRGGFTHGLPISFVNYLVTRKGILERSHIMKKSLAIITVTVLAFFPMISCSSRPQPLESLYGDGNVEVSGLSTDDEDLDKILLDNERSDLFAVYLELPARLEPAFDEVPVFVVNVVGNAPENAIIGIGTARRRIVPTSRSVATIMARADISRQLEIMARDMVTGYLLSPNTDPQVALEFMDRSATTWTVFGSSVIHEAIADDGGYWVVAILSRANIERTIRLYAARLVPGSNPDMWSAERMDAALGRNNRALRGRF